MSEPNLSVRGATVYYGHGPARRRALSDVTLAFEPGSLTLVRGPSGSGKTTLLSVLGCLLTPDSGWVYVAGTNVIRLSEEERTAIRRRHIGFVFQAFRLFHSLTALENVELAATIAAGGRRTRNASKQLLARLGLERQFHQKPDALSGGEKQRVAIARALINRPEIILADEPTASLDSASGEQIAEILVDLAERDSKTVVVVSHDERWLRHAHRVVTLEDGEVKDETWPQAAHVRNLPVAFC
ncbi:MAG TPA: ABC transporter ATP-binding protein [Bryobacteraceae bacterium]|nr:ABC transporter ATP-binding protein [Bryobacteraceae bacterium]